MEQTSFKNLAAVGRYLTGQGFTIKKSTLYVHYQQGKIRPNKGGVYSLEIVQKYVKIWLARRLPKAPRTWAYLLAGKIIRLCETDESKLDDLAVFLSAAFDKPEESRAIKALQRAATKQKPGDLFEFTGAAKGPSDPTAEVQRQQNDPTGAPAAKINR